MEKTLQDLTRQLLALSKSAADDKVLPQEMQLIQEKAFAVQEDLMQLLQEQEKTAKDIHEIQNIYQVREDIWDIMNDLAIREVEVKAKFGLKEESPKAKRTCCHHHKGECCCGNHGHKCDCKKAEKNGCKKEKKTCHKK